MAHWCIPWGGNHINGHAAEEQRSGAADQCMLVALFDGHQGVNAAQQARELVPQQLHAQLKHQVRNLWGEGDLHALEVGGGTYYTGKLSKRACCMRQQSPMLYRCCMPDAVLYCVVLCRA